MIADWKTKGSAPSGNKHSLTSICSYTDYKNKLNAAEIRTWDAFENVCINVLGNKKIRKLRRNRKGATFFIPCVMVQHAVQTPFPAIPLGFFFFREIWQPSPKSTVKGYIRINTEWKKTQPRMALRYELDIGRSVYHFLQYIYIPTRYTL